MSHDLNYITKTGASTSELFDDLALLRMEVFRDFPYLYEGGVEYEKEYLDIYAKSAESMIFAAYDGDKMVGATTCIPLKDEAAEVIEPFLKNNYDISKIFYFGESILLKPYRGIGIGNRFFDEREKHALSFGTYTHTSFCAVVRPDDHPMKPDNYRPNDKFWLHRGYAKVDDLISEFEWLDIGDSKSSYKLMKFWMKTI